jgi:hypothetical protein
MKIVHLPLPFLPPPPSLPMTTRYNLRVEKVRCRICQRTKYRKAAGPKAGRAKEQEDAEEVGKEVQLNKKVLTKPRGTKSQIQRVTG